MGPFFAVLLVYFFNCCFDDRRNIIENGIIGYFDIGLHQVGKYACHTAIGNKIRNHGDMFIGKFMTGP